MFEVRARLEHLLADLSKRTSSFGSQPERIATLLGLKNASAMDDVALADAVAEGLDCHAAISLGTVLGPKIKVVGDIIPKTTFRRARDAQKPLSPVTSGRLYNLSRVWEVALRSYGNDDAATEFLLRKHTHLDGRAPIELVRLSSAGADAVVNLIHRAQAGFAA